MNFACAEKHYLIIVSKKEHAFLKFPTVMFDNISAFDFTIKIDRNNWKP